MTKLVGDTAVHLEGPVCASATLLLSQTWGATQEGKNCASGVSPRASI